MQPTTISQPILTQPVNIQPSTFTQSTITQPILTQPVTTTQQVFAQPVTSTIPVSNQPILETSMAQIGHEPVIQEPGIMPATDLMTPTNAIKSDFGKIKALEVLTFKEAELERTLNGRTTFATVGNLQVLYFPNFDRFVLSLNDWKYPLLRRIPIVSSGANMTGPIQYSLPTYNGFYTLRLHKVPHLEALQNLETILVENSKFSYLGTDNVLKRDLSPDDRFRGQSMVDPANPGLGQSIVDPTNPGVGSFEGSQAQYLPEASKPTNTLSRGQKIKRGFKMLGFKLTKGLSRKGKHNMNHLQQRDIDTIKRTSEITVPTHMYPRKEVERWISYSKEIASRNGFEPELAPDYEPGMGSPLQEGRMRGYGSVDLGQGFVSDPAWMGISSEPLDIMQMQGVSGTIGAGPHHSKHTLYTKPSKMDKFKSKLPGTHRYSGEKIEGYTFPSHAQQTHHGFTDKLKTKVVGHDQFTHQGLADPNAGIGVTQSLYTGPASINPSGMAYTGPVNVQSHGTAFSGAPIYSGPAIYAGSQGTVIGPATTTSAVNQVINQGSQPITQTQQRLQSNLASNIPTQHVDIMRGQEYLAPDQA